MQAARGELTGKKVSPALSVADKIASGGNLSILEFSAWSGVCRRSVYNQIAAGRLKTVRVGRRRQITASAALAWQASL